jgi:hypothetical protein
MFPRVGNGTVYVSCKSIRLSYPKDYVEQVSNHLRNHSTQVIMIVSTNDCEMHIAVPSHPKHVWSCLARISRQRRVKTNATSAASSTQLVPINGDNTLVERGKLLEQSGRHVCREQPINPIQLVHRSYHTHPGHWDHSLRRCQRSAPQL